jgi:hypothetical protein
MLALLLSPLISRSRAVTVVTARVCVHRLTTGDIRHPLASSRPDAAYL